MERLRLTQKQLARLARYNHTVSMASVNNQSSNFIGESYLMLSLEKIRVIEISNSHCLLVTFILEIVVNLKALLESQIPHDQEE